MTSIKKIQNKKDRLSKRKTHLLNKKCSKLREISEIIFEQLIGKMKSKYFISHNFQDFFDKT